MNDRSRRVWIARFLIGIVTFWNLLAAIQFLISPSNYLSGFELQGETGKAILRGMGLLFVMWNVPYLFALAQPFRYRRSLVEAVIMQTIGAAGETLLLLNLSSGHHAIHASVSRFILFDSLGLLFLLAALMITQKKTPGQN